jgi:hypothetical protein
LVPEFLLVIFEVVEKPAETQTSIRLASHLVGAPNSRSGGRELEFPKSGKILGVRSFNTAKIRERFLRLNINFCLLEYFVLGVTLSLGDGIHERNI